MSLVALPAAGELDDYDDHTPDDDSVDHDNFVVEYDVNTRQLDDDSEPHLLGHPDGARPG